MKKTAVSCLLAILNLLFVFSENGYAQPKGNEIFALDCKDSGLISSFRHKWQKEGFTYKSRFDDVISEAGFHAERLSNITSESWKLEISKYDMQNFFTQTQFHSDIEIQPESMGLPESIDGCKVLPIIKYVERQRGSKKSKYIGNITVWNKLETIDKLAYILFFDRDTYERSTRNSERERFHRLSISEEILDTTLEEMTELVDLVHFNGLEIGQCEWFTPNDPKKCKSVRGRVKLTGIKGSPYVFPNVRFYEDGAIKEAKFRSLNFEYNKEEVSCGGTSYFDANGKLVQCIGFDTDELGNKRVQFNGEQTKNGLTLTRRVFDAKGRIIFAYFSVIKSEKSLRLPRNYKLYTDRNENKGFELHSNGRFKAGFVEKINPGDTRFNKLFYMELSSKGKIIKQIDVTGNSRRYPNRYSTFSRHYYNYSVKPKIIKNDVWWNSEQTLYMGNTQVFQSTNECKIKKIPNSYNFEIPPKCSVVVVQYLAID